MKLSFSCATLGVALFCTVARAGSTADAVVSYNPGTLNSGYTDSSTALGSLSPDAGDGSIMTAFNAAWTTTRFVGLSGDGGQLTLHLSSPILIVPGAALGVHTGSGLNEDFTKPTAQNLNPAADYTNPRTSTVEVSADNSSWFAVASNHLFTNPSNYYDQGITNPGFTTTPGTHAANQFQPFFGNLSSFNGEDWPATLATLNGSAGGDWFDLSGLSVSQVNYVRFDTSGTQLMYVDAVIGVPEPASLSMIGVGLLLMRRRRMGL